MFWDGSFEYPQNKFWLRNKKNDFHLHTQCVIECPALIELVIGFALLNYECTG